MVYKKIGTVLVEQGFLTPVQLEEAERERGDKTLEAYLLERGFVNGEQIARSQALVYGVPFIEQITEKMARPELLSRVALNFLRDREVIPVILDDGSLMIVMAHLDDFQTADDMRLLLQQEPQIGCAMAATIISAINRYYPLEGTKEMIEELAEEKGLGEELDLGAIKEEDILHMASEAPIIKLVNHILYQAVKRGASDIHLEPFEKELRVRFRIDGIMYSVMTPPKRAQAAIISRLKIMANLNIAEKRQPQDGRIQIKIADKAIDIRVSILPVSFGERVVMRLLDKTRTFGKLQNIGFSERDYKIIEQGIHEPNGIILVTGPTGSGKTSTLYSVLSELNTPEVNIITVEDPVEYQMAGIGQVQVREKIGLTFAAALRSILRQDPDIVMIGETRDQETAQIAIQAALTGHLVLSTVHTNSAPATITRLIDMGIEPFLIASTINVVVAQRLVRKLCQACKQAYTPEPEILGRLGLTQDQARSITFYRPGSCEECLETGYRGRLAVFEVMVMTPAVARLTMERADTTRLRDQCVKDGMTLLIDDGVRKIREGLTSVEEVLSVATGHDIEM